MFLLLEIQLKAQIMFFCSIIKGQYRSYLKKMKNQLEQIRHHDPKRSFCSCFAIARTFLERSSMIVQKVFINSIVIESRTCNMIVGGARKNSLVFHSSLVAK